MGWKVEDEKFIDLYNKGLNDKEISEEIGCTRNHISYVRREKGLIANYKKKQKIFMPELPYNHPDRKRAYFYMKKYNLTLNEYDKVTRKCLVCKFNIKGIVECHHIKKDNKIMFFGLCPNHHKMLHKKLIKSENLKPVIVKGGIK